MPSRALACGVTLYFVYACSSTASTNSIGSGGAGGKAGAVSGSGGAPEGGEAGEELGGQGGVSESSGGEAGGSPVGGTDGGPEGGTEGQGDSGAGGTQSPGDAGAAGSGGCVVNSECPNPHPATCSVRCTEEGVCETTPSSTLNMPIQSGPRDSAPRTGFWDANGDAYLVYPSVGSTPIGITIQALDGDGALEGTPSNFAVSAGVTLVDAIAAAFRDNRLGLLWHGETGENHTTEFAVVNLSGAGSTPLLLNSRTIGDPYPDLAHTLFLHPLASNRWATIVHSGKGARWSGYVANPSVVPSPPPLQTMTLDYGPYSVTARSPTPPTPQAVAVIGNTLFVTGYDCEWFEGGLCEPMLVFARYDVTTLARLDQSFTTISTTSYPMSDERQRTPVIGNLGDRLATFWTQYSTAGALLLGRALFNADGTIATMRTVAPSNLIPKAVVESPSGGVLLVAAQVTDGLNPNYTLVAQRLDANLDFIGSAYPLNAPASEDPFGVLLLPSGDGRALLTFRQGYAQHRILHADLCQ